MSSVPAFDALQALFTQSPNSTVIYDREGRPLAVNPAFERLWGTGIAAVPPGYSVLSDPQLTPILPTLRRAFAGEAVMTPPIRYDVSAVTGAGRTIWTEAQVFPVRDVAGDVARVVLVHHDVTARIEEEERLRSANLDLSTTNEFLVQQQSALEESNERLHATLAELEEARDRAEQAAEAARLGAERYRALMETASGRVWTAGPDGQVLDETIWNEVTGQTVDDTRGSGWAVVIHPEDREGVVAHWRDALGEGHAYEQEFRMRQRDGSYRWFRARAVPLRNPDGTLREWVGMLEDINDETREAIRRDFLAEAGRVLGESLDYERTLHRVATLAVPDLADWCAVDMLDDPTSNAWPPQVTRLAVAHKDPAKVEWAIGLRHRMPTDWSATTGLPRVLREGVTEFYPIIDAGLLAAAARDEAHLALLRELDFHAAIIVPLVARGRVLGAVTFAMTESGRHYALEDQLLAEAFAARVAAAVDNARLLAATQAARAVAERAAARTERLQAVTAAFSRAATPPEAIDALVEHGLPALEADECSVCLLTADGSALQVVRSAEIPAAVAESMRHLPLTPGLPMSEAVIRREPVLVETAGDMAARYPGAMERYDQVEAVSWMMLPFLVEERAIGAAAFGFRKPRHFDPDEVSFAATLATQCAQAIERARLYEAARTASAAKSQFLATMSHELRTPLNAIAGHVQLIEMGLHGPLTDPQREALSRVARAQRHLLGLINDVLNFSRLEAGRVDYDLREILVRDVVTDVVPMIEPQLAAKGIHFQVHTPETLGAHPVPVLGDREKAGQVLLNLLSNAVKFTPHGGCVGVTMRESPADPDVMLVDVSDSGVGIAGDKLERIFDPFVQVVTDAANRSDGTGLGLAISRELARGMGGDLTVTSTPGKGSRFTMALPRFRE